MTIPILAGLNLLRDAQSKALPNLNPYAQPELLQCWPSEPAKLCLILVFVNQQADHPFGLYLGEILPAEGLNCFQIAEVAALKQAPLSWYDLEVLVEGPLAEAKAGFEAQGSTLVRCGRWLS